MTHFARDIHRHCVRGFTIVELMVALLVLGTLTFIALPAYQRVIEGNAVRGTTADLIAAVNIARAQAVNLRGDVTVEATDGDWAKGWILKYPAGVPEEDQSFLPRSKSQVALSAGSADSITFNRLGVASPELTFLVCLDSTGESGRAITVSRFGKVKNELHECN